MAEERRSRVWLWLLIGGGAFFVFVLAVFTLVWLSLRTEQGSEFAGFGSTGKIAVVDLDGVILSPKDTVKELRRFGNDSSIKAIILHINSPGGGAAASEEIYREVRRVRDQKKKRIVASIETVGASGAYYAASATNRIFADDASVVGSIGVIAEWYNYGDLLRWAKLKEVVIKAGEFKDIGNPAREMTPAEREFLQGMIDNMHSQFINAVADGRGMKPEELRPIADGRVWTGQQAVGLKLVDQIGDFRTCVEETAKAVGIKGEPTLVRAEKEKKTALDLIFGDLSEYLPDRARLMQKNPGFYFLWK
jgi:protease-4